MDFIFNMELILLSFPCLVVEPHAKSPCIVDHSGILLLCCSLRIKWTERKAVPFLCSWIDEALARLRSNLSMLCLQLKTLWKLRKHQLHCLLPRTLFQNWRTSVPCHKFLNENRIVTHHSRRSVCWFLFHFWISL